MGYIFVADSMGLSSFKFLWYYWLAPKDMCVMQQSALQFKVNSGSSKVVDFGTNRKRVYDFLLVINSNLGPILHRFGDTAVLLVEKSPKSPVRTHPCLRNRPRSGWLLSNFVMNQIFLETRMFRLSDGEEIMTLALFVLIQYRSVTDRRTDGQTDISALAIPALA